MGHENLNAEIARINHRIALVDVACVAMPDGRTFWIESPTREKLSSKQSEWRETLPDAKRHAMDKIAGLVGGVVFTRMLRSDLDSINASAGVVGTATSASSWTSVEMELPPVDEERLLWTRDGAVVGQRITDGIEPLWSAHDGSGLLTVTHWMALPGAPDCAPESQRLELWKLQRDLAQKFVAEWQATIEAGAAP